MLGISKATIPEQGIIARRNKASSRVKGNNKKITKA